jgi:hypothetical protein
MNEQIRYVLSDNFKDNTDVQFQTLFAGIGAIAFVVTYAWVGSFESLAGHYFYHAKLDLIPTVLAVLATIVGILIYRYITYLYNKSKGLVD